MPKALLSSILKDWQNESAEIQLSFWNTLWQQVVQEKTWCQLCFYSFGILKSESKWETRSRSNRQKKFLTNIGRLETVQDHYKLKACQETH